MIIINFSVKLSLKQNMTLKIIIVTSSFPWKTYEFCSFQFSLSLTVTLIADFFHSRLLTEAWSISTTFTTVMKVFDTCSLQCPCWYLLGQFSVKTIQGCSAEYPVTQATLEYWNKSPAWNSATVIMTIRISYVCLVYFHFTVNANPP